MTCSAKNLLVILTVVAAPLVYPQSLSWQQTNGPFGGRVRCFAIDSTRTILAGTSFGGVYRSTNDGSSWTRIGAYLPNSYVNAIAANQQGHLFVGMAFEGAYRSTNNGAHWTPINNGLPTNDVSQLAINSLGHIYAGAIGIFRSTNNGNTWTDVSSGFPLDAWVSSIVITPSDHIFATFGWGSRVFRSTDNGISWAVLNASPPNVRTLVHNPSGEFLAGTPNGVFRSTNEGISWNHIGLGGQVVSVLSANSSGAYFAGIEGVGVARSTDGGITWFQPDSNRSNINIRALIATSTNTVLAGNEFGGIQKSSNNGETWTPANQGLINTSITELVINRNGILFANASSDGLFRSTDDGQNWEQIGTENMGGWISCLVARSDSEVYAGTWEGGVFRSTDEGESWHQRNSGLTSPIVISIAFDSSGRMFAATGGGVYRSTDFGEHWVVANAGVTNLELTSMVVSPSNVVFLGSHNGIFRSTNSGETWTPINSGLSELMIDDLAVSSNGYVFAAGLGGVYRSTNGGNSWSWRGFSGSYVRGIRCGGTSVFVATWWTGMFMSTNEGETWTTINAGLNDKFMHSIAISENGNVFAGSGNTGVYRSPPLIITQTCTPRSARTWVAIRDNGAGRDTLWFGQDPTGDYGLDEDICEIELPPPPLTGVFDARWVNPPGREGLDIPAGMGQGFKQDYRQHLDPLDVDTFKVRFQPGDGGFPIVLKWSIAGILAICDSAWLRDEFGGIFFSVPMHVAESLVVSNPAFNSALVIRFGADGEDGVGVKQINSEVPQEYALEQNYPNPFNPSTTIEFAVSRLSKTDVAVYDILGKKVATLISEQLVPGYYRVEWNGTNEHGSLVSSGVYMLRMNAVDEKNQVFSAVRKLMLTK